MSIPLKTKSKKGKHIQIFSDDCEDCKSHILNVEVGKCGGCLLEVHAMDTTSKVITNKVSKYTITTHPTTIIDEIIKIEGLPSFYWMCGDEFYEGLKQDYPLHL